MIAHNKDVIFTDVNDWRAIGADYHYFWELRSKKRFVEEEANARLGLSDRTPLDYGILNEAFVKFISEYVEAYKKNGAFPTRSTSKRYGCTWTGMYRKSASGSVHKYQKDCRLFMRRSF